MPTPKPTYLALDLSYRATGWATNLPGRAAGRRCFPLRSGGHDQRAKGASEWLETLLRSTLEMHRELRPARPFEVVYELPISHHPGALAGQYAAELQRLLRDHCVRLGVPVRGINNKTLKKFATNNGNADKDAMVHAASRRFATYDESKDPGGDEADARWLLAYAEAGFPVVAAPKPARKPRKKRAGVA